ncbi:MAG TPA: hypothetical protein VN200_04210 [Rhodoglobus sp.]|nr:hypothetical protein [Rhodoglobus sp.]
MDIKKTAFGTAAAAALIVAGTAAPAMASGGHGSGDYSYSYDKTSISKWSSYESHKTTTIAPNVEVLNGDILNGNSVGSGNETNTPILSGNETAIGNGNETAVGNVSDSGNGNAIGNVVGNETGNVTGNDVASENLNGNHVSDVVDIVTETSVKDVVDVDDVLNDVSGWVDIDGMFGH